MAKKKTTRKKVTKRRSSKEAPVNKLTKKKVSKNSSRQGNGGISGNLNEPVTFHYIKGPDFKSVHIDGAIGGLTTKGFLHAALFAERAAIPQETTHLVNDDGSLGDEIFQKRVTKKGIVRQMEIDIIFNEETALNLRNWLDRRLVEFEERKQALEKQKQILKTISKASKKAKKGKKVND